MVFPGDEHVVRAGLSPRAESLALDARILQEDAFCHEASGSLKYLLLLNGVAPTPGMLNDRAALHAHLAEIVPDGSPGEFGPIAILLIL
jgi:hypothetical protein